MPWQIYSATSKFIMPKTQYKSKKTTESGDTVYEYSNYQIKERNKAKADQVEKLDSSISKIRKKVKEDLKSDDWKVRMKALAVGLMDETYSRVGNLDSADDHGHFGTTTWRKKHVTFSKGKAKIKYVGKSGVKQDKTVNDKQLVKVLKERVKNLSKDDSIFECEGDEDDSLCIRAADVNNYLEEFDITAKDIRGYHANDLMREALKEVRKKGPNLPSDKKEKKELLEQEFKKALEEVCKELGHEDATLRNQYLVPGFEEHYIKEGKPMGTLNKKSVASRIASQHFMATRIAERVIVARNDYYDPRKENLSLEEVAERWALESDQTYDAHIHAYHSPRELWQLREYTWTRSTARAGWALVDGKDVDLPGPQKWDAIKEDMAKNGWRKDQQPVIVIFGKNGYAKVGEGNHRLAIARELRIRKVPVKYIFYKEVRDGHKVVDVPQEPMEKDEWFDDFQKEFDAHQKEEEIKDTFDQMLDDDSNDDEDPETSNRVDEIMDLLNL